MRRQKKQSTPQRVRTAAEASRKRDADASEREAPPRRKAGRRKGGVAQRGRKAAAVPSQFDERATEMGERDAILAAFTTRSTRSSRKEPVQLPLPVHGRSGPKPDALSSPPRRRSAKSKGKRPMKQPETESDDASSSDEEEPQPKRQKPITHQSISARGKPRTAKGKFTRSPPLDSDSNSDSDEHLETIPSPAPRPSSQSPTARPSPPTKARKSTGVVPKSPKPGKSPKSKAGVKRSPSGSPKKVRSPEELRRRERNRLLQARSSSYRRWTPAEVSTLQEGVQRFGVGNWKQISEAYGVSLNERSQGDLKDKWRVICGRPSAPYKKYSEIPMRKFLLGGTTTIFNNRYPRDAACKAAARGVELIVLVELSRPNADVVPIHTYVGHRSQTEAPNVPKFSSNQQYTTVWQPSVRKVGRYNLDAGEARKMYGNAPLVRLSADEVQGSPAQGDDGGHSSGSEEY